MAVDRFPVEAGHIMLFARAVGDTNQIYYDEDFAKGTEPGGIIAPPTFVQASAQFDPDYGLRVTGRSGGGTYGAIVARDATTLLLVPGVLGDEDSSANDSFSGPERRIEFAQYTRPREYRGLCVPEVLVSGNHEEIARWREADSLRRTERREMEEDKPSA